MDKFVLKSKRTQPQLNIELESDASIPIAKKRRVEDSSDNTCTREHKPEKKCEEKIDEASTSAISPSCKNNTDCSVTALYKINFAIIAELKWTKLSGNQLNCEHSIIISKAEADGLLKWCEENIEYYTGDKTKVKVMGKWHDIPRKQVAFGDDGISYKFSGKSLPSRPWLNPIKQICEYLRRVTGHQFNFALVNRYANGDDHIGEHRDDESELVPTSPIASLTLGQCRDFVLRHKSSRGKNAARNISPVKIELRHGMLLLMNHPTNQIWYHGLPKRKNCPGVRVNMTFRVFKPQSNITVNSE